MISERIIFLGAGGHARVLLSALSEQVPEGYVAPSADGELALRYLGTDEFLSEINPGQVVLVNGLGSLGPNSRRVHLYKELSKNGFTFKSVVHRNAYLPSDVELGCGVQIMTGVTVQPGCSISEDVIINTGAQIDHDCHIGPHCHIAPGCILCGEVTLGADSHIGAGATILQGVTVGAGVLVGAGALVTKDIRNNALVKGIPAREGN